MWQIGDLRSSVSAGSGDGLETRAERTLLAEVALLAQLGGGRYTFDGLREHPIFACITKSVVRWNLPSRSVE
ncbi:MAG: hypothetical protein WCJ09_06335 [Planctomycetota bacterium]